MVSWPKITLGLYCQRHRLRHLDQRLNPVSRLGIAGNRRARILAQPMELVAMGPFDRQQNSPQKSSHSVAGHMASEDIPSGTGAFRRHTLSPGTHHRHASHRSNDAMLSVLVATGMPSRSMIFFAIYVKSCSACS
jgi:hypothetical protein